MKLLKPFAGLLTNPATGALSHSKHRRRADDIQIRHRRRICRMDVVVLRCNGRRLRAD